MINSGTAKEIGGYAYRKKQGRNKKRLVKKRCPNEIFFAAVAVSKKEIPTSIKKREMVSVGSDDPVNGYSKHPAIKVIRFVAATGNLICTQIFLTIKIKATLAKMSKAVVAQ